MKILALADLHVHRYVFHDLEIEIHDLISKYMPDVILIAGDLCENEGWRSIRSFLYESLDNLGIPIIFCLGNHDFYGYAVDDALKLTSKMLKGKRNLCCLDTEGFIDIQDIRFVGNVLWYDGSLSFKPWDGKIIGGWRDSEIVDFDPIKENHKCVEQIKTAMSGYKGKSVLLTHCVPWSELNLFQKDGDNPYNVYSGMKDLFLSFDCCFDIAICGHTHRPITTVYDKNGKHIQCINIGNDYYHHQHFLSCRTITI